MELGFRELAYLAGILVSISGAFYVARFQIKSLVILVSKHDKRLVSLHYMDKLPEDLERFERYREG